MSVVSPTVVLQMSLVSSQTHISKEETGRFAYTQVDSTSLRTDLNTFANWPETLAKRQVTIRGDMWYGDVGTSKTVGGKCDISFFVKMCYLWPILDSIFQNHLVHLMMFTENISL